MAASAPLSRGRNTAGISLTRPHAAPWHRPCKPAYVDALQAPPAADGASDFGEVRGTTTAGGRRAEPVPQENWTMERDLVFDIGGNNGDDPAYSFRRVRR